MCVCLFSLSDASAQRHKALNDLSQKSDIVIQDTSLDKGKISAHIAKM